MHLCGKSWQNLQLLASVHILTYSPFRYFFHATDARIASDAYNDGDSDTDDDQDMKAGSSSKTASRPLSIEKPEVVTTLKVEENDDKMDPALAEWLKIDDKKSSAVDADKNDSDSATDADSDNADVADADEDDLDDWFKVELPGTVVPVDLHESSTNVSVQSSNQFIIFKT